MNGKENHPDLSEVVQSIRQNLSDVPALVHSWRFLAGVVYALNRYYQVSDHYPTTKIDDKKEYIQETDAVIAHILEKEHPNRNWLRGFYYNAGVMRLDACYERIFKAYFAGSLEKSICPKCGKHNIDGRYLYNKIQSNFSSLFPEQDYEKSTFGKIRHEVNSLKHYVGGADLEERSDPELLLLALTELIDFLRDPKVTEELIKQFPGKDPIEGRQTNHK